MGPFDTDAVSLHMQLIDLKSMKLGSNKFTDLTICLKEIEREKSNFISQHKWAVMKQLPKMETTILKQLGLAILTIIRLYIFTETNIL